MKSKSNQIAKYNLDASFHRVHKEQTDIGNFGLDNSSQLICSGYGLYSSAGLKQKIGPIKSEFFRIGFVLAGTVDIRCGLELFHLGAGSIAFTFPGQVFSLENKSEDLFVYYMLFTEEFIADALSLVNIRNKFKFLDYSGRQCFKTAPEDADEIEQIIHKIDREIKVNRPDLNEFIQLHIHLLLLQANRSYKITGNPESSIKTPANTLTGRFKKLVSQNFITLRKVTDYASLMHISANHLNKTIKKETDNTAHELIEEMLLLEAKALILHTDFTIAEIAYQLNFSDPSHFNKFFKKQTGKTPLQFRNP